jgi:hypothetical protein
MAEQVEKSSDPQGIGAAAPQAAGNGQRAGASVAGTQNALRAEVWLTRSRTDQTAVKGTLEYFEGREPRLSFTTLEKVHSKSAHWLENASGRQGLAEQAQASEGVTVLDVPREGVEVTFPRSGMGTTMYFKIDGEHLWRFCFYYPYYGRYFVVMAYIKMITTRKLLKPWKAALGSEDPKSTRV